MAKFGVHQRRSGEGYLLNCQADLLDALSSRFVVPLLPLAVAPQPASRLNPIFEIAGDDHVMVTQFAAAVRTAELGDLVLSLKHEDRVIGNALDMLISGF